MEEILFHRGCSRSRHREPRGRPAPRSLTGSAGRGLPTPQPNEPRPRTLPDGRPASGAPSASMGPAPGRGGRSLARCLGDGFSAAGIGTPPSWEGGRKGRAAGGAGGAVGPARRSGTSAGGGRPAVRPGGRARGSGGGWRSRRLSDPPAVVGERLPARLRGAEGARPDPPRSAACPEGGFPLPVVRGGGAARVRAGPEVPPRRPSVRLSCPALAPARSTRGCRDGPRASPFTVPALLSAFHCVLSAFREFASPSSVRAAFTQRQLGRKGRARSDSCL